MRRGTLLALAGAASAVVAAVAVAAIWAPMKSPYDMERFPASCGLEPELLAVGDVPSDFLNGGDDREEIDSRHRPWSAIGVLTTPRTSCSATLIGSDLVVTALHCVMLDQSNTYRPEFISLAWGVGGRAVPVEARATELHFQEDLRVGDSQSVRDVVMLRLDRTVGDDFGHVQLAAEDFAIAPGLPVDLVGYVFRMETGSNQSATLERHTGCAISALAEGGQFASDCDVLPGSSGSPVLRQGGESPVLVGVVTNILCRREGGALGGSGITSTELWRRFPQLLRVGSDAPQ